ncbi:MAG TPA: tRNA (adenosine(37)-N6)-dimethylallyltransferase MiaA [Geobacteraceae bacterium]
MPAEPVSDLVAIVGPTASGKSALAIRLAEEFDGEIVNADSMQVYRGMDIGTAKPSQEDRRRVPHHLIDIVDPGVNFSASDFRREAAAAIADIVARGKRVFVVGGTGLYLKSLLEGLVDSPRGDDGLRDSLREQARVIGNEGLLRLLAEHDPVTAARLHPNDQVRIIRSLEVFFQTGRPMSRFREEHGFAGRFYNCVKIAPHTERAELYRRIDERVDIMVAEGLIEEVRGLISQGFGPELKAMRAIGYKEMCAVIAGACPLDEAVRLIKRDTRHYAKRQMTWFARDPEIKWVEYPDKFASIKNIVIEFFAKGEEHAKSTVQYPRSVS